MAAATPISPHHDRCRGGEKSEGEDLTTPPGTHRRTRPAPKMPPEHHPHAPFGKGRQKSRQKENIDIVGKKHYGLGLIAKK